ncbi:MAG: hypothetical protein RLZZ383_1945 [Pseudomonadota bacterium]|jgi:formylglycine-generating enzyme required for sulfatase activity
MRFSPLLLLLAACGGTPPTPEVVDAGPVGTAEPARCAAGNDRDGDRLPDDAERAIGTNMNNPDTDGDGVSDGDEVCDRGTDPRRGGASTGPDTPSSATSVSAAPTTPTSAAPGPASPSRPPSFADEIAAQPRPVYVAGTRDIAANWRCEDPSNRQGLWPYAVNCLLWVPPGVALLGAQASDASGAGYDAEAQPPEQPVRSPTMPGFWMSRAETGVVLWRACVRTGACQDADALEGGLSTGGRAESSAYPVNGVTFAGATAFCAWLGGRLPTSDEWEYAARGPQGWRYPWGTTQFCGYGGIVDDHGQRVVTQTACTATEPRSSYDGTEKSPFGHMELGDNLSEWVADPPSAAGARTLRGGSWTSPTPADMRAARRALAPADVKLPDIGFRCVFDGSAP